MSEMVERMARAMAVAGNDYEGDELQWHPYVNDARAALEALMEPTPKMIEECGVAIAREFTDPWDVLSPDEEEAMGLNVDGDDAYEPAHKRVEHFGVGAFKAMIAAALEEKA